MAASRNSDDTTPASADDGEPKRTRRRAHRSAEERRTQIVDAAREAFARSSLHGASTREIAKAADINPATLFEHFGSKETLFREAVIAPLLAELGDLKARVPVYQGGHKQISIDMARSGVAHQMDVMKRLFPLFTTALFSDLDLGKSLYREHFIPLIEERVQATRGLASPEFDPYFLELAALGIFFIVAMDETFGVGRLDNASLSDQVVRLITIGSLPPPLDPRATQPQRGVQPADRRRVGRSDLWVSPLALDIGAQRDAAVVASYLAHGGNFIETSNRSDMSVADIIGARRQEIVLASRHHMSATSGSFRFRLIRSIEESLHRLGTDHIDLLVLGDREKGVPVEEIVDSCAELVRTGKIRHAGLAGCPAWQVARIGTAAEVRGSSPFVAVRMPHDTIADGEMLAAAGELDLGIITAPSSHPPIVEAVVATVAQELDRPPSAVASAWRCLHATIASEVIAPRTLTDLEDHIAALQIRLSTDQIDRLEAAPVIGVPSYQSSRSGQ